MSKLKILVIGGGPSEERVISSLSSKAVFDSLEYQGYPVEYFDWDGSTKWFTENLSRFDIVLPVLHGAGGEDGVIQKILEDARVSYLGSNSQVSELCFDKTRSLKKMSNLGITIPEGEIVTLNEYKAHSLYNAPHVLKPFDGGSSIDTYILADPKDRPEELIVQSFKKHPTMLVEQFIEGVEITVPILDGELLPTIEIRPPKNGTFDYINKYNGATIELCPAEHLSQQQQQIANEWALKIYRSFGCRHLARIDMIVANDNIYVLEVNTLPGMTDKSLFPKASAAIGINFDALVVRLVELAQKGDG